MMISWLMSATLLDTTSRFMNSGRASRGIYYHRVISRAYRVALDVPLQVAGNSNGFEDHQDSLLAHSRVATIGLVEHHSQHIFLVLGILIGIVIDV